MAGSVLVEMGQVLRSVPGPGAPVAEVAAWYGRKAALLEHAAEQGSGPEAAALTIQAGQARRRAARLVGRAA